MTPLSFLIIVALGFGLLLALRLAAERYERETEGPDALPAQPSRATRFLVALLGRLAFLGARGRRRRAALRAAPLPSAMLYAVQRNVPVLRDLAPADRRELLGHAGVLLAEKSWEGAGGLELTDAMRATIAAQAALLLLHRDTDYFPRLTSIILYPTAYRAPVEGTDASGWSTEGESVRLGETAAHLEALVLSWSDVLAGGMNPADGANVVLHEFAHQLDFENGAADGVPALDDPMAERRWRAVLQDERHRLDDALGAGEDTLLGSYAATNAAEFFAVAVERFFERPEDMRDMHPALYREMAAYFHQDPASWR